MKCSGEFVLPIDRRLQVQLNAACQPWLNRRLYDTLQQTAINTFGSVRQRVAVALLDLASAQQPTAAQRLLES